MAATSHNLLVTTFRHGNDLVSTGQVSHVFRAGDGGWPLQNPPNV